MHIADRPTPYDNWVEPGLIGRLAVTPAGSVQYQTHRVQLKR